MGRWSGQKSGDLFDRERRRAAPDEDVGAEIGPVTPHHGAALGVDLSESLWVLDQRLEDLPPHEGTDVSLDYGVVGEVETQVEAF